MSVAVRCPDCETESDADRNDVMAETRAGAERIGREEAGYFRKDGPAAKVTAFPQGFYQFAVGKSRKGPRCGSNSALMADILQMKGLLQRDARTLKDARQIVQDNSLLATHSPRGLTAIVGLGVPDWTEDRFRRITADQNRVHRRSGQQPIAGKLSQSTPNPRQEDSP